WIGRRSAGPWREPRRLRFPRRDRLVNRLERSFKRLLASPAMTKLTMEDVRQISLGFDPDPARSMSLRSEAYTEAKGLDSDLQAIFARTWQWVCHVEQLAEPGSYVSATIAGTPVAVVRDREGVLRAFYNVCKHRAHELLSGSGTTGSIVCPYHAWVYSLD